MTHTSIIGTSPPRHDALAKVSGAARYPGDLAMPGMLHMAVLFARRPHARITRLDPARALAHPGVVAVLTAADIQRNEFGLIENDQPVLCDDVVRFVGDKVALVVAESEHIARAACALIEVDYRDLPVAGDPVAAMQPDAPLVRHWSTPRAEPMSCATHASARAMPTLRWHALGWSSSRASFRRPGRSMRSCSRRPGWRT
jgi:CO/xanthine dehydrogenase Mo-binding subunit